ncbi:EscU/YscU/HrcU family type III secretion system export apparatus switch protein [Zavarzinia sp. CC-PAN008]|uniref:EscU/YscU/HrcU family type III secretion system export apparatus switch protein n=1 Tax=Zavarzinia sp. CC-PAN008 TaxID=3243332 RepID=UPI003F749C1B
MDQDPDRPVPPVPPRRAMAAAVTYDPAVDTAPRVTAVGRGAAAEEILRIAFANGVKVREDADLAEMLGALDVDCPIPLEAFWAVAEILSYVYQANDRLKAPFVPPART